MGTLVPFEETLLGVVRSLPPQRAAQVLDFARWLLTQPEQSKSLAVGGNEDLEAEEALWDHIYFENRETFRTMAREALEQW